MERQKFSYKVFFKKILFFIAMLFHGESFVFLLLGLSAYLGRIRQTCLFYVNRKTNVQMVIKV